MSKSDGLCYAWPEAFLHVRGGVSPASTCHTCALLCPSFEDGRYLVDWKRYSKRDTRNTASVACGMARTDEQSARGYRIAIITSAKSTHTRSSVRGSGG